MSSGTNRQAQAVKDSEPLTDNRAEVFRTTLSHHYWESERRYQAALKYGVPKELARCLLPVGRYSKMRASANLRNWLAFLTLRFDERAQYEIREYAKTVAHIIEIQFPRTYKLWAENKR